MKSCKIAFILNGGLGSILVGAEYIKKFYDKFEKENNLELYAYCSPSQAVSDCIMKGAQFIKEYYTHKCYSNDMKNKYDIVIEIVFFPFVHYFYNNSNISKKLDSYINRLIEFQKSREMSRLFSLKSNVKNNIYEYGMLNNLNRLKISDPLCIIGIEDEYSYRPKLHYNCTAVLNKFNLEKGKFITFQRGTNSGFSRESIRDWPIGHYNQLILKIKKTLPQYKIVQLGESLDNCKEMSNVDLCLLGKTDLEEVKCLLACAALHIDGECGMVHMRKALGGGASVVFMGAAPAKFFGYKNNINMETHPCGGYCHGLSSIWYKKCLIGDEARCMTEITPDEVIVKIEAYLNSGIIEEEVINDGNKVAELLNDSNVYIDEFWKSSWLVKHKIYDYKIEKLKIKDLKVKLLSRTGWEVKSILESPSYQYILGNTSVYESYMKFKNKKIKDGNINSTEKFDALIESLKKGYQSESLTIVNGADIIMDGQHRACWQLSKFGPDHEINVLKIYGDFDV